MFLFFVRWTLKVATSGGVGTVGGLNNKITNNCEKGNEKFTSVFQALGLLLVKCSYSLFIIGKNMLDLMQIVNHGCFIQVPAVMVLYCPK